MLNKISFIIIAERHLQGFFRRNPQLVQTNYVTDFMGILKEYGVISYATVYDGFAVLLPYEISHKFDTMDLFMLLQHSLSIGFLVIQQQNLPSYIQSLLKQHKF